MMQLALIPCKCARRVGRLTEPPAVVAPSARWPLQRACAASTSVCPLRLAPVPEPQPTFLARLVSSVIAPSNLSGTCMGECSTRTRLSAAGRLAKWESTAAQAERAAGLQRPASLFQNRRLAWLVISDSTSEAKRLSNCLRPYVLASASAWGRGG